jgi:hypothetical protein
MNKIKILGFALAITAACTSCRKKDVLPVEPMVGNEMGSLRMSDDDSTSIIPGRWTVNYFCKDMVNMTRDFEHAQLLFDSAGTVHAYGELDSAIGSWNVAARNFTLNFTVGTRYSTLNGVYYMTFLSDHSIRLQPLGQKGKLERLELKKLLLP